MRFERVCFLATCLIVHTSCSGATTVASAVSRGPTAGRAVVKSPPETDASDPTPPALDPTAAEAIDLLSCLAKRWYSNDGPWNECFDAFSSFRDSAADPQQDNGIGERRKGWNEQTLMLGAGFKMILLIPVLAILAGKAITLSLSSLLITSLGLLSMNSLIH